MIVYGWDTYLLAKFLAHEVGLAEANQTVNYHLEFRQKYFYISWIPLYPMKRVWYIRKHEDKQLYELTPEAMQTVKNNHPKIRIAWYAHIWNYGWFFVTALMIFLYAVQP